jgi:hypothetical protein
MPKRWRRGRRFTASYYRTLWLMAHNAIHEMVHEIILSRDSDAIKKLGAESPDPKKESRGNTRDKIQRILKRYKEYRRELKTADVTTRRPA